MFNSFLIVFQLTLSGLFYWNLNLLEIF
jgi:hypothetical protein